MFGIPQNPRQHIPDCKEHVYRIGHRVLITNGMSTGITSSALVIALASGTNDDSIPSPFTYTGPYKSHSCAPLDVTPYPMLCTPASSANPRTNSHPWLPFLPQSRGTYLHFALASHVRLAIFTVPRPRDSRPGLIASTLSTRSTSSRSHRIHAIDSIHTVPVLSDPRYRLDPHRPGLIGSTLSTR